MDSKTSGILVVDKPPSVSSASVVGRVKRTLGIAKIGHAGTLDPFATGVLVCCLNKATRLAGLLIGGRKSYEALLYLGVETDTQDTTGRVIRREPGAMDLDEEALASAFAGFKGVITQEPPVFSALKHRGVPLYKLARAGTPVQKPARQVEILALNILDVQLPEVRFEVTCSAGTYIRTLCSDLGRVLGCGGHLKALRRTWCSGFSLDQAVTLEGLEALVAGGKWRETLVNMREAIKDAPVVLADGEMADRIQNGRILSRKDLGLGNIQTRDGLIAVVDEGGSLIAVLRQEKDSTTCPYYCVLI